MITSKKKAILFFLIAGTMLVFVFIGAFSSFFNSTSKNIIVDKKVDITPSPSLSNTQETALGKDSPLERTEIGKTTEQEVKKMSGILGKKREGDITIYLIRSSEPGEIDEIRTRNGIVIFEKTSTETATAPLPNLDQIFSKYGKPEYVKDKVGEGFYMSAYIYPSKGIAIYANRYTKSVYEIQRFIPMSLEDYVRQYGENLSPAPEMPRESSK